MLGLFFPFNPTPGLQGRKKRAFPSTILVCFSLPRMAPSESSSPFPQADSIKAETTETEFPHVALPTLFSFDRAHLNSEEVRRNRPILGFKRLRPGWSPRLLLELHSLYVVITGYTIWLGRHWVLIHPLKFIVLLLKKKSLSVHFRSVFNSHSPDSAFQMLGLLVCVYRSTLGKLIKYSYSIERDSLRSHVS